MNDLYISLQEINNNIQLLKLNNQNVNDYIEFLTIDFKYLLYDNSNIIINIFDYFIDKLNKFIQFNYDIDYIIDNLKLNYTAKQNYAICQDVLFNYLNDNYLIHEYIYQQTNNDVILYDDDLETINQEIINQDLINEQSIN